MILIGFIMSSEDECLRVNDVLGNSVHTTNLYLCISSVSAQVDGHLSILCM
jgi:hypothetical protein